MKVIVMVRTVVSKEVEVDDKFAVLREYPEGDLSYEELAKMDDLSSELLQAADESLPDTGYWQEVLSVKTLDGTTMAEW